MATIRRAQAQDIPALGRLLEQVAGVHAAGRPDLFVAGGRKYTDEQLLALLPDERAPIFVYDDGGVQGYAFCRLQQPAAGGALAPVRTLYIDDLCVDAACRGRHVGRALYEHVRGYAKEIGCYNLTLNVWACNPAAAGFYAHMGLRPQKVGMEEIL